jgi:hypothetical protein
MFLVCVYIHLYMSVDGAGKNTQLILTVVDLGGLTTVCDNIYLTLTFP